MVKRNEIVSYLTAERKAIESLDVSEIDTVFNILNDCLLNGKTVYVFGNGGSGSTASHMTNDFNKALFEKTNMVFDFRCLNDNMATILAVANDTDYSEIFRYQLEGRLNKDDVIIAFSGSGNSKNVINAVEYAKEVGATVVGFTGYDGGVLRKMSDYSFNTNICNMQITEDIHLIIEHLLISTFFETYGEKKYRHLVLKKGDKKDNE